MSLKYRSSDGTETPVAGLNGTSGELVPSVALYQSGTASFTSSIASGDSGSLVITFQTPMPDTDYIVSLSGWSQDIIYEVTTKLTTGFTIVAYNKNAEAQTPSGTWQAFKLMTDEVHEADSAHIARNTANFASAFSDTTSYAVGDYVTYNNVLYRCTTAHTAGVWDAGHFTQVTVGDDLEDLNAVIPSDASSSNQLATKKQTTVSYQKSQTVTAATGDWQEVCTMYNIVAGTYLATIYRSAANCGCNLQTPELSSISLNWLGHSKVQSVLFTLTTTGKVDVALKGTSGSSYDVKLVLEKVSDEYSSASSSAVGIGLTTSSVTAGSTAPITSGGVYTALHLTPKSYITAGSTTTISGLPNSSPMLLYIWDAENVSHYIIARIYTRPSGQSGSYEIIKNNTLTITAVGDGSVTVSGSENELYYKIIC